MRYFSKLLLLALLFCTGCTFINNPKQLNLIVRDPHFQSAFKTKRIQLVAPSSGTDLTNIKALQSIKDLNIEVPENLQSNAIAFHSNTDEERFLFLKEVLYDNSKNTVIWCLRGGYGSARLIDKLKKLPKPKNEKIFIGFSDVTALHLFLSQHWKWKTIHGSELKAILDPNKDPQNFQRIADIISKRAITLKLENLTPLNKRAEKLEKITGRLTGGNLTLLQTSIGTDWQINTENKILFLEERGAKGYQIDRALLHLKQARILKHVKAIIFGDFSSGDEYNTLALERFSSEIHIPVFKTNQFGHGNINYPLIYNTRTDIISTGIDNFTLIMHLNS